jgi:hypothetical protein
MGEKTKKMSNNDEFWFIVLCIFICLFIVMGIPAVVGYWLDTPEMGYYYVDTCFGEYCVYQYASGLVLEPRVTIPMSLKKATDTADELNRIVGGKTALVYTNER